MVILEEHVGKRLLGTTHHLVYFVQQLGVQSTESLHRQVKILETMLSSVQTQDADHEHTGRGVLGPMLG